MCVIKPWVGPANLQSVRQSVSLIRAVHCGHFKSTQPRTQSIRPPLDFNLGILPIQKLSEFMSCHGPMPEALPSCGLLRIMWSHFADISTFLFCASLLVRASTEAWRRISRKFRSAANISLQQQPTSSCVLHLFCFVCDLRGMRLRAFHRLHWARSLCTHTYIRVSHTHFMNLSPASSIEVVIF